MPSVGFHTKSPPPGRHLTVTSTSVSTGNAFNALNDGLFMLNALCDHAAVSDGLGRCSFEPLWGMCPFTVAPHTQPLKREAACVSRLRRQPLDGIRCLLAVEAVYLALPLLPFGLIDPKGHELPQVGLLLVSSRLRGPEIGPVGFSKLPRTLLVVCRYSEAIEDLGGPVCSREKGPIHRHVDRPLDVAIHSVHTG